MSNYPNNEAARHDAGPLQGDALGVLAAPLMRAEEVTDLLAIKTSTVYELSRRRRDPLPSVRIGRAKRFERRAVAQWVRAQTAT
jgi:excisionase family DNA binding protein